MNIKHSALLKMIKMCLVLFSFFLFIFVTVQPTFAGAIASFSRSSGHQAQPLAAHDRAIAPDLALLQLDVSQTITPTKRDDLAVDNSGNGLVDPGDTVEYTVVISNSPAVSATNVLFSDTLDLNTVLSGTVQSTPLALPDSYSVVGNTHIVISATNGVLSGNASVFGPDFDPDGGSVSVVPVNGSSTTAGGDITIAASGAFTYTPPLNTVGSDSFTYTIIDDEGQTNSDVISFTISEMIWWVDNSAPGGGDGRSNSPFNAVPASIGGPGDTIFIYETNSGNYSSTAITLTNNQQLIGHDFGPSDFETVSGISRPLGTTFPNPGNSPTLTSSGNAITLASGNTIRGLTVGDTTSSGTGITGNNVGNLVISDVTVSGSGRAVNINTGGTLAVTFDSLSSSSSSTQGINLDSIGGSFTALGGSISGATGTAVDLNGGGGTVTYAGSISNTSGRAVEVTGRTGGTVTFQTGTLNDTGATGIRLASNTGGSVNFNGEVNITNSTGAAVTVDSNSGGTFSFADIDINNATSNQTGFLTTGINTNATLNSTTGTINSGTGTAVDLDTITLGVTLVSLSSNGGAAAGIDIVNTTGSFSVVGDGSNARNGSGGTITGKTGRGVTINRATNITLNSMNITFTGDDGLQLGGTVAGDFVSNFTMIGGFLSGNGNAMDEEGIELRDVQGTLVISNTRVTNAGENGIKYFNDSGFISSFTFANNEIDNHSNGSGLNFELQSGAGNPNLLAANASNNNVHNNFATGLFFTNNGNANMIGLTVQNNTLTDNNIGLDIAAGPASNNTAFDVLNNTISSPALSSSHGMNFFSADTAGNTSTNIFEGRITGNIIGTNGVSGSGSDIGNGIRVNINDPADADIEIDNNQVYGIEFGRGIEVIARLGAGTTDVVITNNIVNTNTPTSSSLSGIYTESNDGHTLCARIVGNNVTGGPLLLPPPPFFTGGDFAATQGTLGGGSTFNLEGTNANYTAEIGATNTANTGNIHEFDDSTFGLVNVINIVPPGTCLVPALVLNDQGGTGIAGMNNTPALDSDQAPWQPLNQSSANEFGLALKKDLEDIGLTNSRQEFAAMSVLSTDARVSLAFMGAKQTAAAKPNSIRAAAAVPFLAPGDPGEPITMTLGTLSPGKVVTLTFQATITDVQFLTPQSTSVITNQATFTADNIPGIIVSDDPDTAAPNDPTVTPLNRAADLGITKDDGLTTAVPGTAITYTIVVTNAGPESVFGATVTDTFPVTLTGISWSCSASAGSSCTASGSGDINESVDILVNGTMTYSVNATIDSSATGTLSNTATITATVTDPVPGNNSATDNNTVLTPQVDIEVTQTESADPVIAGSGTGNLVYTVTVHNNGPSHASGVALSENMTLPSGVTLESITPSQGSFSDPTWTVGGLPSGASATLTAVLTVGAGTTPGTDVISNTASLTAVNEPDTNASNNSAPEATSVIIGPDLAVTVTADPANLPEPGGTVTFTVNVNNTGAVDLSLNSLIDDVYGDLDTQGSCLTPQTITVGNDYTCQFTDILNGNAGAVFTNTVTAAGEGNAVAAEGSDTASVTISDVLPAISVSKTANPTSLMAPGGPVTFTIRVNNLSLAEAVTLTGLVDDIYGNLAGQGSCLLPQAIPVGGFYECAFSTTLSGAAGDSETNTVTATAEDDEANQVTAEDQATVSITANLIFLPIVVKSVPTTAPYPDLIVENLTAAGNDVTAVIKNIGNVPVTDAFWVDGYIDPFAVPSGVNQTWPLVANEGLVWGVSGIILNPGDTLTLSVNDIHYRSDLSNFPLPLVPGTPVYAQVDSANSSTTYGNVLEGHESYGGPYNNITGTISTATTVFNSAGQSANTAVSPT